MIHVSTIHAIIQTVSVMHAEDVHKQQHDGQSSKWVQKEERLDMEYAFSNQAEAVLRGKKELAGT